ncbi:MAG: hypothetical protein E7617_00010 [Ruminococcaceae bacterium]|nr:hypothetical protein [Oscillospiraceae bacterium]
MKKIISAVCLAAMLLSVLMLSGCGSFFAEEELVISSVTAKPQEDGSTLIVISYSDDMIDPTVFVIPKGEQGDAGERGNGIDDVTYSHDDEKKQTDIVITFTDPGEEPISFSIPDGSAVARVSEEEDPETGDKYIVFVMDNESVHRFLIPEGKPGEDGVDGADGRGVETVDSGYNANGYYYIKLIYTDGTESEEFVFANPPTWFTAVEKPAASEGNDGDFCFDTTNLIIYKKSFGAWETVVDLTPGSMTHTVTFYKNAPGDNSAALSVSQAVFTVPNGNYFSACGADIPTATRDGYKFVGWYTKSAVNTATMSAFTDLTPVLSDLELYAAWEKIEQSEPSEP